MFIHALMLLPSHKLGSGVRPGPHREARISAAVRRASFDPDAPVRWRTEVRPHSATHETLEGITELASQGDEYAKWRLRALFANED